jgi:hypothetical protein
LSDSLIGVSALLLSGSLNWSLSIDLSVRVDSANMSSTPSSNKFRLKRGAVSSTEDLIQDVVECRFGFTGCKDHDVLLGSFEILEY